MDDMNRTDSGDGGNEGFTISSVVEKAIEEREKECLEMHAEMPLTDAPEDTFCSRTFDGWSCWNDTQAGRTARVPCPDFIPGFNPERFAHKECKEDGTWFRHPETNEIWSNYTNCVDVQNLEMYQNVNSVYLVGYSTSLVALLISLVIFFVFRSLKCTRITIHKNLFASFILNNSLYLLWHKAVLENVAILDENGVGCQTLHILMHYFLVCNYFWMFCEGLHLHTLLIFAFVTESKMMKWFLIFGWLVPSVFTIVYAILRAVDETANSLCWIEDSPYNYVLSVPVVFSMLVNLFFLINIVRVLLTKLRAGTSAPDSHTTRKAVRATLILIPLLGLHYILLPFRPHEGSSGHGLYLFVSAVATSFQGFGVSLLFCFFNGEVLAAFKKKWNQRQMMKSPQSYANTTMSYMKSSVADGAMVSHFENCVEADQV